MDLVNVGYRFRAYLSVAPDFQPGKLVGAQVRVRGTAAEAHNRSLRQLVAVEVYIPNLGLLIIVVIIKLYLGKNQIYSHVDNSFVGTAS